MSGGASKKDLETLFQLIYLRFTAPRPDPVMFQTILTQSQAMLANQAAQPEYAFFTTLTAILSQNAFRAKPMDASMLTQMNLDKATYDQHTQPITDRRAVVTGKRHEWRRLCGIHHVVDKAVTGKHRGWNRR